MTALPKLPTTLSTQLRNIVKYHQRNYELPVLIARQHCDSAEYEFSSMVRPCISDCADAAQLIEDSNSDALSYPDHLTAVHSAL